MDDPDQPGLFRMEDLPEGHGLLIPDRREATGARQAPEKVEAVIQLRAAGVPVRAVARALRISEHTIAAIMGSNQERVATEKKTLAGALRGAAALSVESFMEDLEKGKVKPEAKPVAAGIFLDKARDLAGEASVVIEHRRTGPKVADLDAELASLPAARVIEAETLPEPAEDRKPRALEGQAECPDGEPTQAPGPQQDGAPPK